LNKEVPLNLEVIRSPEPTGFALAEVCAARELMFFYFNGSLIFRLVAGISRLHCQLLSVRSALRLSLITDKNAWTYFTPHPFDLSKLSAVIDFSYTNARTYMLRICCVIKYKTKNSITLDL